MSQLVSAAIATSLLQACASTPPAATSIPANLAPQVSEKAAFKHFARGAQIYKCEAQAGAAPAWKFVAPEAQLFSDARSDKVLGTHGAGPFWRANEGSRVVGTVKNRADAPSVSAIPWLLLSTKADPAAGEMRNISSIQRIETLGGVAPASACSVSTDVGKDARVPYTAVYVYFAAS